jgi:hypothetical protein
MLEMRPFCECCGLGLPPEAEAFICSLECTFCRACVEGNLQGRCPNCGGALAQRPTRAARLLSRYPASTDRIVRDEGCPPTSAR